MYDARELVLLPRRPHAPEWIAVALVHASDGELIAVDEHGKASFQALPNRASVSGQIAYYAFDFLHLNGENLMRLLRKLFYEELGKSDAAEASPR
jgi:ATP-dependent DNA ligase